MSPRQHQPSPQLRRAALAEQTRIHRSIERLAERQATLQQELMAIEGQLDELAKRNELLDELIAPSSRGHQARVAEQPNHTKAALRGRALRVAAVRLLYHAHGADKPIHYREWFSTFLGEGFDLVAKDPLASFLTNVTRSPLVVRGQEAGTYLIRPAERDVLARELSEKQAELEDLLGVLSRNRDGASGLRDHRSELLTAIRRLETQVEEADRILSQDAPAENGGSRPVSDVATSKAA